jgi:hypothetical protein
MSNGTGAISSRETRKQQRTDLGGRMPRLQHVLLLLMAMGCARHRTSSDDPGARASSEIALVIDNHHWNDVVISVLHDGIVDRIGMATAVKTSTFILPSRRLGTSGIIRLRGHAVGASDDHTTDAFPVQPGQQIEWTLESDLARSSVAVH